MFSKEISHAGFVAHQLELANYFIDFIKGNDTLFITFESAGGALNRRDGTREPWGFKFLVQKRGYSLLGIKPKYVDWYRKNDLHQFFRSAEFSKLTSGFKNVVLYGGSMGGYAALAFAEAIPGCTVISLNPQSTLNKELVPTEYRFKAGIIQNWQGHFNDGAVGASFAKEVYVVYDPLHKLDKMHVERLNGNNVTYLRVPLVGHEIPVWLVQMGILGTIVDRIMANDLNERSFYTLAQARKNIPRYFIRMATNTKNKQIRRNCANRALAINPTDQDALLLLCKCLFDESKFIEVVVISENILQEKGIEYAFKAYQRLGKLENAINILVRLTSVDKEMPLTVLLKATTLALSINQNELASQLLAKAMEKWPNNNKINQLNKSIQETHIYQTDTKKNI